jgi:hypothetical protein
MPSDVTVISHSTELIVKGLAATFSQEPLVAVNVINEEDMAYRLLVSLYIPNAAGTPVLDLDFSQTADEETDAGSLTVRLIMITPDWVGDTAPGYSLWNLKADYIVNSTAAQAQAVRVHCYLNEGEGEGEGGNGNGGVGGPETPRGTVTTVKKTIEDKDKP